MSFCRAAALGSICLFSCTILMNEVTRLVQEAPQRIEEVQAYEWCIDPPKTFFLMRRTFWRVDRTTTTRNERTDTPASQSQVLWERLNTGDE